MASKQRSPRGLTPDGFKVLDFMMKNNVNGNHRDFVLFVGDQMYEAWGRYTMHRGSGDETQPMVALVHKRDLHKIIGKEAARFWDRRVNKRTSQGSPRHYAGRELRDADGKLTNPRVKR